MTVRTVRLPDVGEGIAEAELVSWFVAVGDTVTSETVIAEVLTDKATVEIYAPVAGTVTFTRGEPGDVLAIGSDFVGIDIDIDSDNDNDNDNDNAGAAPEPSVAEAAPDPITAQEAAASTPTPLPNVGAARAHGVAAAPAVRERARLLGIDLAAVVATGPGGHVTHRDLDRHITQHTTVTSDRSGAADTTSSTTIPVIGVRRRIASRMSTAWQIPHITYVEEIDMTSIERLRRTMGAEYPDRPKLTVLPFVMRSIVLAVRDQPNLNATFADDADPQALTVHNDVHIGIATQTSSGLVVPVVRDAQALDLWQSAVELKRVSDAARDATMTRVESTGSTITITSLGALGGLMTTPIINHPEVAIVGINKLQTRPMWDGTNFVPRTMMNVSSSFDHRVIDGWDAATFIQRIKTLLEEPTLLFI
jgi:2-oxoisovalerate dehydrogenase E2 component (dihydrolipoyl transacylase)